MTYSFSTVGSAASDTYLRLYQGSLRVASNNDAGDGLLSTVVYKPSSSGTYTLYMGCNGSLACAGTANISPGDGWQCTGAP